MECCLPHNKVAWQVDVWINGWMNAKHFLLENKEERKIRLTCHSLLFVIVFFFPPGLTPPSLFTCHHPHTVIPEVQLNTLDLGRPVGAKQRGPAAALRVPGSVPALVELEGFGRDFGLWVMITAAHSYRRGAAKRREQGPGLLIWALTHTSTNKPTTYVSVIQTQADSCRRWHKQVFCAPTLPHAAHANIQLPFLNIPTFTSLN